MNDRMKAALIGGALIGLMSLIPFLNTCCCLWAIGGGVLAVFMYLPKSTVPMRPGDGAVLGVMAGGVGALIYLVVTIPVTLLFSMAEIAQIEDQVRGRGIELPLTGMALILVGVVAMSVALVAFAAIGGMIGVPLLEKRGAGTPPPPPPPDFSQLPGGFGPGA